MSVLLCMRQRKRCVWGQVQHARSRVRDAAVGQTTAQLSTARASAGVDWHLAPVATAARHSLPSVLQPAMTAVSAAQPSRVVSGPSSTTSYHRALQPCRTTHALQPQCSAAACLCVSNSPSRVGRGPSDTNKPCHTTMPSATLPPPCSFFPNVDSDDFADEAERDEFYKLAGEVARAMAGEPRAGGSQRTHNSRRAGSSRRGQGRGRGGGGTAAAARQGQPVPGWEATGQYTQSGKQLFSGTCSSCGELCTVPFRPIQGRSALCCYSCHHGGSNSKQQ